jgi:hypothetical protein
MKSFLIVSWTLLVAAVAFSAGRWMQDEPIAQDTADVLTSSAPAASPNVPLEKVMVVKDNPQKVPSLPGKSSYATDYQQLQLLVVLAATNPQLAMEKAQTFKGAIKAKAESAVLEVWAATDPNAAWNWVESTQPQNNVQFIKLLEVIGRNEPRTAISYAEKFVVAHRELRKDSYSALVAGLTQNGAYGLASEVVGRLDIESDTKAELMNIVIGAWATYEPQVAMQWVMTQPEDIKAAHIERLGEAWSDTDPQAAVNFAATQNDATRASLLLPSFKKWLTTDPAAAAAWLTATQRHKDFDEVIAEMASQPSTNNSEVKAALAWAGQVHDPELRVNTVISVLSAFKQKDPKAAAAYLQEITYLTDSERKRLVDDLAFGQ